MSKREIYIYCHSEIYNLVVANTQQKSSSLVIARIWKLYDHDTHTFSFFGSVFVTN